MTEAHAKSFIKRTSRCSILKGLGAAAVGISLSGKKYSAWAAGEEPKLNGRESLGELGRLKPGRAPRLTPHTLRRL
jgi:hypothetical protein